MNLLGINKAPEDTKVIVAMSGGVDSSTVAAMMVDQGYEVIGITMQLYDHGFALQKKGACCAGIDIYDAKMVADKLDIPHYVLNYESKFKESVMDDFADSYLRGETPIPCVKCNQTVKFTDMLKMAKDLGGDVLVTGHYVRTKNINGEIELHQGVDSDKDQSYFLFATTKEQLEFVRFPLGEFNKAQTREIANKHNLQVADKPESQDICFVPNGKYATVVEKLRPGALDSGEIIHLNGQKLGEHSGIINFTVGQRKGLGVSYKDPLYVIKIDPENKIVYVGPESALFENELIIKNVNWLIDVEHGHSFDAEVKIRSMQGLVSAKIMPQKDCTRVVLKSPTRAISPGQACVIYNGSRVLGGGWIIKK